MSRWNCCVIGIVAWLALASRVPAGAAPSPPQTLRCDYLTNPAAIDDLQPRLDWVVQSSQRGDVQTAYEIVVSSSEAGAVAGTGDLWDSGKVESSVTTQAPYAGKKLTSAEECWWTVRWWDGKGQPSAYAVPAWWKMGLLNPTDWKARWIGLESMQTAPQAPGLSFQGLHWAWYPEGNPATDAPAGHRYFRKAIDLPVGRTVKSAQFLVTCDDQFTLYVNGKEAGRSDGQTDAWRQPVIANVAKYLAAGQNALAIDGENTMGAAGLIGRLVVTFDAGPALDVPIDHTWKANQAVVTGWQNPGFDDVGWKAVMETLPVGQGPWGDLGAGGSQAILPPPYLRTTFGVDKPIQNAYIRATALGLYELHINGQRVSNDIFRPGWFDYRKRMYYQTYDVTKLLQQGQNAVGAILADGWAVGHVGNGGRNRYGLKRPRFLAQLNITYTDGSTSVVATGPSWKATFGPIILGDLLDGETYDARREMPGWDTANFADGAWRAADVYENWPTPLQAYPGVPVRAMMELKPVSLKEPSPGAYVFDLGQNMVGWARIKVSGPAGTQVRLRFAEMLNPDGTVYTANLRGAKATDYYTLKGTGEEVWAPRFTFHGFRYVELTGLPANPGLDAVTGVVIYSDEPTTGSFQCSNPMVNQLASNIMWGQRGNYLEVPTDCPQRDERCGWMGDAQIFVRTGCYNMDVSAFFTKWMVDMDDARRGAAFSDVSPDVCCGAGTAGWADAGIIVPWTIYEVYGDKEALATHYDAMRGYVDYMQAHSNGLIRPAAGYGDWLAIGSSTPTDVIATAYFAYSTSLVAKAARVLGKTEDAQKYEALFAKIRDAFDKKFVSADVRIPGDSQTDYLLALWMNLLPPEQRPAAVDHLVQDIQKHGWRLTTGFIGVGYLNPTLSRFGRTDVAYRLLNQKGFPSWLFPIEHGATTIWERWDGWTPEHGFQNPGMNSFNHYSLGSVGEWLYGTVGGIDFDPDQPGFQRIIIRPEPGGGLTWAKTSYNSIHGMISTDWAITAGALTLKVVIPTNTTATVYVPAPAGGQVLEGGKPAAQSPGVKADGYKDGADVFEVGAGSYVFTGPAPAIGSNETAG